MQTLPNRSRRESVQTSELTSAISAELLTVPYGYAPQLVAHFNSYMCVDPTNGVWLAGCMQQRGPWLGSSSACLPVRPASLAYQLLCIAPLSAPPLPAHPCSTLRTQAVQAWMILCIVAGNTYMADMLLQLYGQLHAVAGLLDRNWVPRQQRWAEGVIVADAVQVRTHAVPWFVWGLHHHAALAACRFEFERRAFGQVSRPASCLASRKPKRHLSAELPLLSIDADLPILLAAPDRRARQCGC